MTPPKISRRTRTHSCVGLVLELPYEHASTPTNKARLTGMFQSEVRGHHFVTSVDFLAMWTHEWYRIFWGSACWRNVRSSTGLRFYGWAGGCGCVFLYLTYRYRRSLLYVFYGRRNVPCFLGFVCLSIFVCRGLTGDYIICTFFLFFTTTSNFLRAEINTRLNDKAQNVINSNNSKDSEL